MFVNKYNTMEIFQWTNNWTLIYGEYCGSRIMITHLDVQKYESTKQDSTFVVSWMKLLIMTSIWNISLSNAWSNLEIFIEPARETHNTLLEKLKEIDIDYGSITREAAEHTTKEFPVDERVKDDNQAKPFCKTGYNNCKW